MERDEKEKAKKREKKLEDEETLQQATWVKYTIPIKHQVGRRVRMHLDSKGICVHIFSLYSDQALNLSIIPAGLWRPQSFVKKQPAS